MEFREVARRGESERGRGAGGWVRKRELGKRNSN
jgi:hypothetical protein